MVKASFRSGWGVIEWKSFSLLLRGARGVINICVISNRMGFVDMCGGNWVCYVCVCVFNMFEFLLFIVFLCRKSHIRED